MQARLQRLEANVRELQLEDFRDFAMQIGRHLQ